MNGYVVFYRDDRYEVYADTPYAAQQEADKIIKAKNPRLKKINHGLMSVTLAEKNGEQVTHIADF